MTVNNGTSSGTFVQFGTGNTFGGINRANGTYLAGRGAGGLTINTEAAQPIYFAINNSEKMRLSAAGYLGINMAPIAPLDVNGTIRAIGRADPAGSGAGIELNYQSNISNIFSYDRGGSVYKQLNLDASFTTFAISGTEAARFGTNGYLGIGTTSPSQPLHVAKSTDAVILLASTTAGYASMFAQSANGAGLFGTNSNYPLAFYTNTTERARIGTDGSFLVGTTTNGGYLGNASVSIQRSSAGTGLSVYSTTTGQNVLDLRSDSTGSNFVSFNSAGTKIGTILGVGSTGRVLQINCLTDDLQLLATNSGNSIDVQAGGSGGVQLTSGATAWSSLSDYRAKDVVEEFGGRKAADIVQKIPVHLASYNLTKGAGMPEGLRAMFLAHEVQEGGVPWAVHGEKDGEKLQRLESTDTLLPIVWAALQNALARLAALENK